MLPVKFSTTVFIMLNLGCIASAQNSLDDSQRALKIITEFAISICSDPAYSGSNSSISAGAKAKADLGVLVRKLTDAKVEIGAEARRDTFQGLLQKDLLEATKNAQTCRMTIFNDLKDRLLPKPVLPRPSINNSQLTTGIVVERNNQGAPKDFSTSSAQRKANTTPPPANRAPYFIPEARIGESKQQALDSLGSTQSIKISSNTPPLEYIETKRLIGGHEMQIAIFFKNNRIHEVVAKMEFDSGDYYTEFLREPRGPRRQPGLTRQTYEQECPRMRDQVYQALSQRQALASGSLAEYTEDNTARIEREVSARPLKIKVAEIRHRKAKFERTDKFEGIDFHWEDFRWDYQKERDVGTGSPYVDYVRTFVCRINLVARAP